MQFQSFPAQFIIPERAQEEAKHWARGKGLGRQWQGPIHEQSCCEQSLDLLWLAASYAAHTTSSGSRAAVGGRLSHSSLRLSTGTQWNSSRLKRSYKWTQTRQKSPRNHTLRFKSFGEAWRVCVHYSWCILGHQGQTLQRGISAAE